jgi:lipopolysaccharide/colanic/teichoic acid biosynthesis glycosyltransferase
MSDQGGGADHPTESILGVRDDDPPISPPEARSEPMTHPAEPLGTWGHASADPPVVVLPFLHDTTAAGLLTKRAMDLLGAIALLIATAPLWLLVALAIRLDGPGPVFFLQERVGARPVRRDGRIRWTATTFTIIKFRTMTHGADPLPHMTAVRAFASGETPRGAVVDPHAPFKLTADPRITRVGKWLRRTSIDELPQLLNVLAGSMSLVGPRPLPAYEVAEYQPWHYERLCAKPGITGLWQIAGRGRTSFDDGTRLDIEYVRRRSFTFDIQILLKTVPAVLAFRGAR